MNPDQIIEFLTQHAGGKIACFGSRETPQLVGGLMHQLGYALARNGFKIASGHCAGADWAWELGACEAAPSQMQVMLPWATYNTRPEDEMPIHPEAQVFDLNKVDKEKRDWLYSEAEKCHGAWHKLTPGGKALQARNIMIGSKAFMGLTYLNPNKAWGGGSGQANKYITSLGAPVWDFSKQEQYDTWCKVLVRLLA